MIALDTNLLVRLLVLDDPRQVAQVEELLREAAEAGESCFISDPVLCELEWVLESSYKASRVDILTALQSFVSQELFVFEDREICQKALAAYQRGKAEFADYLIGTKGHQQGARSTYTFDRDLRGQEGFTLLG